MQQGTRVDVSNFGGNAFRQPTAYLHFSRDGYYQLTDMYGNISTEFYNQGFDGPCLVTNVKDADGNALTSGACVAIF